MVRIELEGDYAIVHPEMLHKTTKAVRQILVSYMKEFNLTLEQLQKKIEAKEVDSERTAEIILLNQVTEWSFGKVDQETLEIIPESKYQLLSAEVDKLYTVPLAGENLLKKPSEPSLRLSDMQSR